MGQGVVSVGGAGLHDQREFDNRGGRSLAPPGNRKSSTPRPSTLNFPSASCLRIGSPRITNIGDSAVLDSHHEGTKSTKGSGTSVPGFDSCDSCDSWCLPAFARRVRRINRIYIPLFRNSRSTSRRNPGRSRHRRFHRAPAMGELVNGKFPGRGPRRSVLRDR